MREALEKTGAPGLAVVPQEGGLLLRGRTADGHGTLVHEVGAAPFKLELEVALEAPADGEEPDDDTPRGAGLVFMTGPDEFVAFVLMPGGRTGVFEHHPGRGLKPRIMTRRDVDGSEPHTLTLTFDGRSLMLGFDGQSGAGFGNARIAAARGPVGVIVLGDGACVVRRYAVKTD